MFKRIPYADEPIIPALLFGACIIPIVWIRSLGDGPATIITADRWIYIFGMGLALALLAVGLAGLRFVRTATAIEPGRLAGSATLMRDGVLVLSAVLVGIGGSLAIVAFALGLYAPQF